jgi:cobalt-zinc-cadmium efflux system protein
MHDGHSHAHISSQRGLKLALLVTAVWFAVEALAGFYTNSLALLGDAGHMLSDLAALSLSLLALKISALPANHKKTFGYVRAEILAALANGVILVVVGLLIAWEGYQRLFNAPEIKSAVMLAVAVGGLAANAAAALLLARSDLSSLNLRGAFLHVVGDILGSLGAIIAGILMWWKSWFLADPIVSLIVAGLIVFSAWRLLRDSADVLLEGTPRHLDIADILADLGSVPGVIAVHDLHVWSITSGKPAMSCHVEIRSDADGSAVLDRLTDLMRNRHQLDHTTIQIEKARGLVPQIH